MNFDVHKLKWTREPADYIITEDKIEIITNRCGIVSAAEKMIIV